MSVVNLFRPPRLHNPADEGHRTASWLELFYDLVYVATFVQLGNHLSDNVTLDGFVYFVLLFVPIWWSWVGTTFYINRFDTDDVLERVLVFGQIFTVAAMAIFAANALDVTSSGFALAYAANRFILLLLYVRAWNALPDIRPLTGGFIRGFGVAAALWFISAFLPEPIRYPLWIAGLLVDILTPFTLRRWQVKVLPSSHHMAERFALLTIIVYGEGFLKIIGGLAPKAEGLALNEILFDIPGLIIAISLWWLYFDNSAGATRWRQGGLTPWIYLHLPYQLAVTAMGVALYKVAVLSSYETLSDPYRLLLCFTVALALVAYALIEWFDHRDDSVPSDLLTFGVRIAAAVVVLGIGFFATGTSAALVFGLVSVPTIGLVLYDLFRRYRMEDIQSEAHHDAHDVHDTVPEATGD
jgi:low temperature requirement protein LtrA